MIKMKNLIKESTWTDRKFGDPLPTLEDYMSEAADDKYVSGDEKGGDAPEKEPAGKLGGGDFEREFPEDPDDIDNLDTALDDAPDTTDGDPDDSWDDEEGRAKPVGEITINGKKYRPMAESIKPMIYDPHSEIKKTWKNISSRQFDRKWKKEII